MVLVMGGGATMGLGAVETKMDQFQFECVHNQILNWYIMLNSI
jgi:hypothetical protein